MGLDKFFSDLNLQIDDLFTGNEVSQNSTETLPEDDKDLFLSKSKLWFCFRKPGGSDSCGHNYPAPVKDINAPYLVGLFPIHLALLTSSTDLVEYLIDERGARLDVKCVESPFHGMTPLDMILHLMSQLIPWTERVSFSDFTSMFLDNKPTLLLNNLDKIMLGSFGVRDLILKLTLDGKVTELATLLTVASLHDTTLSSMHVPTSSMPTELNNGAPMMLRMFVAATITSLITKDIHLSGKFNDAVGHLKCKSDLIKMTTIMKLLILADRGELARSFIFNQVCAIADYPT